MEPKGFNNSDSGVEKQTKRILEEKLKLDGYEYPNANRLLDEGR